MSLLVGYYQALNAEKAAQTASTYAQMNLTNQQAANFGDTAAAARGLTNAQTAATLAGAGKTGAEAAQIPLDAQGNRDLTASRTAENRTTTMLQPGLAASTIGLQSQQAAGLGLANTAARADLPGADAGVFGMPDPTKVQGFAKGGKVKTEAQAAQGKSSKPGPSDTVPVKLTPGEAVLNKGAAEHYGTDVIDHMNKMGLMRMGAQSEHAHLTGQPDPHAPPEKKGKAKG